MALRRHLMRVLVAASVIVLGGLGVQSTAALAQSGPAADPVGANDWSCRPSPQHPRPVVLVHGTGMSMQQSWNALAPLLRDDGYCVFALNYGRAGNSWGTGDIRASARELAAFVDTVRDRTASDQVDIVGHSQGGTTARQYLRFEGGADPSSPNRNKVHALVMLGPTTHGTTFEATQGYVDAFRSLRLTDEATNERLAEFVIGLAPYQQLIGSRFLDGLNAGGETLPGVTYSVIASQSDEVVTPPSGSFLVPGPGSAVRNEWVQDRCPGSGVSHVGLLHDPRSTFMVRQALDPGHVGTAPC